MFYAIGDVVELTTGSDDTLTLTLNRDMVVTHLAFDATGVFKITGNDVQGAPNILGVSASFPILGRAISDGGSPFMLPETLTLPKGSSITFGVTDLSAADNKVGVVLLGTAVE